MVCACACQQGQPLAQLNLILNRATPWDSTTLPYCRLFPSPYWPNDLILLEKTFLKHQGGKGSHLRHVSGLYWVARDTDSQAEALASFPSLELLDFYGGDRQFNSRPVNSEWWFMVPAVNRGGQ